MRLSNQLLEAINIAQARRYRESLPARPGWKHQTETAVIEVYSNLDYRYFPVP